MKKLLLFLIFTLLFSVSYYMLDNYNKVEQVIIKENKVVAGKISSSLPLMIFDIFQVNLK